MTALALVKTNKPSNRIIQSFHETYKGKEAKSKLAEVYYIAKSNKIVNLSDVTLKFIKHFTYHTGGGATQTGIKKLCKLAGISVSAFYDTVKPEIESFEQPLIFTVKAPMKKDKLGRKCDGTPYKVLQPFDNFIALFKKKEKEILDYHAGIMSGITSGITSNAESPCESKDEQPFLEEQNSSFRENLLEKDLNNIPIPISSDNSYIEYSEEETVKDEFQTISNDLFSSTIIPPKIKYYLKERLEELTAMNFDVVDYERFIMNSPIIDLQADYEDLHCLNEQHLYWITRQVIQQVEYIKTTYGLMKDWCERHLETMRRNMMEPHEEEIAAPENFSVFQQVMDKALKPQEAAQAPKNDFEYKDSRRRKKTSQEPKNEYEALLNKYKRKSLGELTEEQMKELDLVYERCQKEKSGYFDDRDTSDFAWHRYDFQF